MPDTPKTPRRLITPRTFAERLDCHPRTVERRSLRDSRFPKPVKVGVRNFFVEAEADSYVQERMEERDAKAATAAE